VYLPCWYFCNVSYHVIGDLTTRAVSRGNRLTDNGPPQTWLRIRWRIFGLLFAFGAIAYMQQKSLGIAAARMMPELGLSQLQIGWLEQAFVIGYTIFQVPGGLLGQRLGARAAYAVVGLVATGAAIALPLAPALFGGTSLFVALLAAQLVLGLGQGGRFPASAGMLAAWFPAREWSLVQGLLTMGLSLGAAATPPLIASLIERLGWRWALAFPSGPAILVIAAWYWYARNSPAEHRSVSPTELAELNGGHPATVDRTVGRRRLREVLANRNTLLLTGSYLALNYSFYLLSNWCFLYLIQERHLSLAESGWLSAAPPLAAAVGAGVGGVLTSRLCRRVGIVWGFRIVPLASLLAVAVLLLVAFRAANPYVAVAALTACFFCVELTEGAYWGTVMTIGGGDTMTLSGIVNTGGNLGGIIGLPIIALLSGRHSWGAAFMVGSLSAIASAALWLGVDASRSVAPETGGSIR
jgi:ACS family glucarate transporter-like MFS transporter